MTKGELRNALLSYAFCVRELNLYLDTHPDDCEALEEFRKCRSEFLRLKDEYVACGGTWTVTDSGCGDRWDWIDSPWPWEYREEE